MKCPPSDRWGAPCALVLLSFLFLISVPASAFNAHQPFDVSADMINFVDATQEITAEGHVVIVQTSSTLSADFLRYDRSQQRLLARGHVILREKGQVLAGSYLDYDLVAEKGMMSEAEGYASPWLFQGTSWEKEKDYYVGRQASFASCELLDPHYHLRSSRVHFVPDKIFWAWNNIGYADTIPVFYSPFIYKYLDRRRIVFQVQPGNDTVNGSFAKTTTTIRFTDHVYNKVLLDHYEVAGSGIGNEFNYRSKDSQTRGSLLGYYINPKANPELSGSPTGPQYTLRSYHSQQLSNHFNLQSNVNLRKNISFNSQYFAQDNNQSVNDIISSVALTHSRGKTSQRLVVESLQAPDRGETGPFAPTHIQTATLPRFDFTLLQIPLWKTKKSTGTDLSLSSETVHVAPARKRFGPVMFNMGTSIGNTYLRRDEKIHTSWDTSFSFTESIPLSDKFNLTLGLLPQLHWQDKRDPPPLPPVGSTTTVIPVGLFRGFQGRVGTTDVLRFRPFSSLTLDQTYTLTARMEPNDTKLDRALADGGIETNHLTWLAYIRPTRAVSVRSVSGADLRKIADEDPNAYRARRFDPWTNEVTVTPLNSPLEYFARHQFIYNPMRTSLWELSGRYKGPHRTVVQSGVLYNRGQKGVLTWNNTLGVYLSPGWRVDATLNSFVPSTSPGDAVKSGSVINTEFIVTRSMHCWQAQFIYRSLPPVTREYSLLFDLKFGARDLKNIQDEDLESQFYPWRNGTWAR